MVGLIGHNGAGKSTLLKILSRITEPSAGYADVTGRVGSLLEVGTGFHPELTGRENIFLNGAILGMRRPEIRRRFDEIVDFAEIERFLDTPVKRYSSGMSVRLAFAVAAHLEPEILLVDEVLAVGDAAFQRKSLGKMNEVAKEGRTVVFVSHNLAIIQALCSRGVLLERGRAIADAPVTEAIDATCACSSAPPRRTWSSARIATAAPGTRPGSTGSRSATPAAATPTSSSAARRPHPGRGDRGRCRRWSAGSRSSTASASRSPPSTASVSSPSDVRERGRIADRVRDRLASAAARPLPDRCPDQGRKQIQDGLQAAAFFDVEPGVVGDRPMPASGADGDVALPHSWRLPG